MQGKITDLYKIHLAFPRGGGTRKIKQEKGEKGEKKEQTEGNYSEISPSAIFNPPCCRLGSKITGRGRKLKFHEALAPTAV